ncbi:MAG: PRC-barrel domain-containing protein [Thermoplasmata archaeon]|nr:PRC-barrel domain-containing protein [Thermoplasmata archaeon]OYT50361.1 MAG: photosystem reaction center subunit H [Thermoplasmatales archaeon ex4484_36]HDD59777.1 photosystem reaction center subunit H [Euryarchaeota archaeon]RLF55476.1 MAG: photosystem reaction center subunit H [Thermoplasmata archaeon]RLF71756.1 MAG: photosystem reaction center subunit H [Thermoplasmata archaeon]
MLEEINSIFNLPVYTPWGAYLGDLVNAVIDANEAEITSLVVANTNPALVVDSAPIAIPFRWVQAIGDIVILKYFPSSVPIKPPQEQATIPAYSP